MVSHHGSPMDTWTFSSKASIMPGGVQLHSPAALRSPICMIVSVMGVSVVVGMVEVVAVIMVVLVVDSGRAFKMRRCANTGRRVRAAAAMRSIFDYVT